MTCIVQVNGKLRGKFDVPASISEEDLEKLAREQDSVQRAFGGAQPVKVIVRAPGLVNFVVPQPKK